MKTPEGYEKDKIKKYLDSIGAWYFCPYMAGFGKGGVPDIIVCHRGRFISIEVKRPGKEPTERQKLRMAEVQAAGGVAIWGDATKVLSELDSVLLPIYHVVEPP